MSLKDRRQILADFRAGRYRVMVARDILTEGYDDPSISAIIMARPTQSSALYQQAVGRGLRVYPEGGKTDLLVLDIRDRCTGHEVVTVGHLFGADIPDCKGGDVLACVDADREYRKVHPVSPTAAQEYRWHSGEDNPWLELPDLVAYQSMCQWHNRPATDKQVRALKGYGLKIHRPLTMGEASYLIDECKRLDREYPTPATSSQKYVLTRHRLWRDGMTKREATRLIGAVRQSVA
jgi:hypothetical protein